MMKIAPRKIAAKIGARKSADVQSSKKGTKLLLLRQEDKVVEAFLKRMEFYELHDEDNDFPCRGHIAVMFRNYKKAQPFRNYKRLSALYRKFKKRGSLIGVGGGGTFYVYNSSSVEDFINYLRENGLIAYSLGVAMLESNLSECPRFQVLEPAISKKQKKSNK